MNDVCSFPICFKRRSNGFGLIEALIALVILSTTILMMMGVALRQTNEMRDALVINQLHMQADALAQLVTQHPANIDNMMVNWQAHLQQTFPKSHIQTKIETDQVSIDIDVNHFNLKVVSDGQGICSQKISRNDAC